MPPLESLEEAPKYIRYDFFMAIIGLFILYFVYTNQIIYDNTNLRAISLIVGCICLIYGLLQMKRNYDEEMELRALQIKLEKRRLNSELKNSSVSQSSLSKSPRN